MEIKPITVTANVSTSDARRALFRNSRIFLISVGCTAALFLIFNLLGLAAVLSSKNNVPLKIFIFSMIPVFIFLLILFSVIWLIMRTAKRFGENAEETKYVFNEQGMESESVSASVRIAWAKFYKIVESKDDFLILIQKSSAIPLPKRFFENEEQLAEFRNVIKHVLGEKAKLKG